MIAYKNDTLYCEGVSLNALAKEYGTPVYVYSANTIRSRVAALKEVFVDIPNLTIAFAVKVNNNISVLRLLAEMGVGADMISRGELYRYLAAGGDPGKALFSGVAKSAEEIADALDNNIFMFNAESIPELERINRIAKEKGVVARVAARINPDVEALTHAKITTGVKGAKFGISVAALEEHIPFIRSLTNIRLEGVDVHIGSQIVSAMPFIDAYAVIARVVHRLREDGFDISVVDIGGGFGVSYRNEEDGFDFARYKKEAVPILKSLNAHIVVEPGRFLVAESGALLMKTEYVKEEWGKTFVTVDAGMNDYARVALYDAYNEILPVTRREGSAVVDIVGPICESSDFFAKDRTLSNVQEGDILALLTAGAYGYSMASNYNARAFAPEALVDGDRARCIRRRQPIEDLILYEKEFLR